MDNAHYSAFEILHELGDFADANEDLRTIINDLEEGTAPDVAGLNAVDGGRPDEATALLTALNTYLAEILARAKDCRAAMKEIAEAAGVTNPATAKVVED